MRIASGLRAAMILADSGHTVESATLLRTIADFSAEIEFVCEAMVEGRFTAEQLRFLEQHHASQPKTPDELAASEKEYYVGRRAIPRAFQRLAEKAGDGAGQLLKLAAFLNRGYGNYVHGKYDSAMELFSGRTQRFMLNGTDSNTNVCIAHVAIAGKLGEALNALRLMAIVWPSQDVLNEVRTAFDDLSASGEDHNRICAGL